MQSRFFDKILRKGNDKYGTGCHSVCSGGCSYKN
uniref:Uncharacterized protein n=1 Tax=Siphoviridae sp. ct6GI21 TaxID=2825340 RepID=A0A8S5U4F7_9CAUD|nr:MAG TPA: hypothetical protein [Siphoviridae sp. ct6GI21]